MKMKKVMLVLAAAVCMMALPACSGKSDSGSGEAAGSSEAAGAAEEAAEEAGGAYAAGSYTASAKGMESDVSVTITIDDSGKITEATIDASGETPELGGAAAGKLETAIVDAQSAEIDAVSGATMTSNAVIEALTDCLGQAAN